MFEGGNASLPGGAGWIEADNGPSPVEFSPYTHSTIIPGRVRFQRQEGDEYWAPVVVQDFDFSSRVAAAIPASGCTAAAKRLIQERAFNSALKRSFARDEEAMAAFDACDLPRFTALGQSDEKLTVAGVRKELG
ncbi:MAG: hypothetical protein ABJ205_08715 [Erythrobacter sp.]|uniref:hypothetical protein n=1 Tax=Erythrobacter sp. TaxID=1042 RepID=UPI003266F7A1